MDVGGTSTRAVVVADDGTCLGYGHAGSGNPTASGLDAAAAAIAAASRAALDDAGLAPADVALGYAGIAGAGGSLAASLRAALAASDVPVPFHVEGDLLATYWSGTLEPSGYVLVAGTGAVAARIVDGRLADRRDGLGWLLGDRGSGFWIGLRGVRTALAAIDGRGPRSELVDRVLAELGVGPADDAWGDDRLAVLNRVVEDLYRLRPADLARFAPAVFAAADAGDDHAGSIVRAAVDELADTLIRCLAPGVGGPVVVGGSVLARRPEMVAGVVDRLTDAGAGADVVTVADGLLGAAVLALRRIGVTVERRLHARLLDAIAATRRHRREDR